MKLFTFSTSSSLTWMRGGSGIEFVKQIHLCFVFFVQSYFICLPIHGRTGGKKLGRRKKIYPTFLHCSDLLKKNFHVNFPKLLSTGGEAILSLLKFLVVLLHKSRIFK